MDKLLLVWQWLHGPSAALLFAVLFGIDQVLAQVPWIEQNSVFQAISGLLKWIKDKVLPAKDPSQVESKK